MIVITSVTPIFALIAIGYCAARFRFLSEPAQKGLAEFAFSLAMPSLLFRTVATSSDGGVSPLRIWLAYFGSVVAIWLIATVWTRLALRRPATDAAAIAMSASYGNIVMLGIPLCIATFGNAAAAPMAVIIAISTPFMWSLATLHHQWSMREQSSNPARLLVGLFKDLARNPLIIAILAGGLWRLSGVPLPAGIDRVASLLGQAGIPASLVALGVSLAGFAIKGQVPTLTSIIVLKLAVMPAIAAGLAYALGLPPVTAGVVVLFAAMPSGANVYLFAAKVGSAVNSASGAVALGTLLSAVTASLIVWALNGGV
jgi:predicted permease